VIGDFNKWQAGIHAMTRFPDGGWQIRIPLHHGHHRYQFYVDGSRFWIQKLKESPATNATNASP